MSRLFILRFSIWFKGMRGHFPEPSVEETQSNFRPSTSPLTHSSPSQTSIPTADTWYCIHQSEGLIIASLYFITSPNLKMKNIVRLPSLHSPFSSNGRLADRRPGPDLSPESVCSSPSLSRLTYISVNDRTGLPTPERPKVQLDWDSYTETLGSFLQFFFYSFILFLDLLSRSSCQNFIFVGLKMHLKCKYFEETAFIASNG